VNPVRAPVTILVALASVCATLLLGDSPWGASPWHSWLVHIDLPHLLGDVVIWVTLGLWLEPRTGPRRWLAWTLLAAALSAMLHGALYPHHAVVFGLSAVIYAVATGALVAWRGGAAGDPRRWAVLALLLVLLADELIRGESAWRSAHGGWGHSLAFVPLRPTESTPLLHAAAAMLGMIAGLCAASGRQSRCGRRCTEPKGMRGRASRPA
jgi:membrane associated rhomboid family serine protease